MTIRLRLLFILALGFSVFSWSPVWSLPLSLNKYDDVIQSSVRTYWPTFDDWKYWKAQLYQESRFDPEARSPVGATGLAQFMPRTWDDITKQLGWSGISANQAAPAIEAGAFYMQRLRRGWSGRPRPELEKHFLAMASYNAGMGNIVKAQIRCGGPRDWAQISQCLRLVTGRSNSSETITYVERIKRWRIDLGI